jgi:hypothetical protein
VVNQGAYSKQISGQVPPPLPHRRVSDIKNLPSFNLRKEGVQVGVVEWVGDLDHFSELKEVWIVLKGIPPNGVLGKFLLRWCLV